jgi:mannose-6-phosphate isomerase-like protein (cupin superfamily)
MLSLDMNFARTARLMILGTSFAVIGACATQSPLPDPLEAGWKGAPVCEQLEENSNQRILRCTFAPTVGHERHFHNRHFGYAIAGGRMRITDSSGTREVELATGSSYTSDGVTWHEVVNIGNSTTVYLIIEPK